VTVVRLSLNVLVRSPKALYVKVEAGNEPFFVTETSWSVASYE
jgi:hypothetical protein